MDVTYSTNKDSLISDGLKIVTIRSGNPLREKILVTIGFSKLTEFHTFITLSFSLIKPNKQILEDTCMSSFSSIRIISLKHVL